MGLFDIVKEEESEPYIVITPTAGFCTKLRTSNGDKTFVNICFSDKIPKCKDITESELRRFIDNNDDNSMFKVPMSIGEAHVEVDSANKACVVYDVVINTQFYEKVTSRELYETFLMVVIIEGIKDKYNVEIEPNWIVLKNKKRMGKLSDHFIRSTNRPAIVEIADNKISKPTLVEELPFKESEKNLRKGIKPKCELEKCFLNKSNCLIAKISLPKIMQTSSLELYVGYDRLVLKTTNEQYYLELELDTPVDEETTTSEFNIDTKELWVNMVLLDQK